MAESSKQSTALPLANFVGQYLNVQEMNEFSNPRKAGIESQGRVLLFDYPVKRFTLFAVKALAHMVSLSFSRPAMLVGNEAGAVLTILLAAGYQPREILELLSTKKLDVLDLIEGKTKVKGSAHKQVHGADHKGLRLAEKIQSLLREKLKAPEDRTVTLKDVQDATKVPFFITALDDVSNGVVTLCARDYPNLPASSAVLASCAVQPYLNRVEYVDSEKKTHKLFCCSPVQTLPIAVAVAEYKKLKGDAFLKKHIFGYGFAGQINETAKKTSKDSKTVYLETLNAVRPKTVIPSEYGSLIRMY